MKKNLTTGSVFRNILFFSLPYLLSYFLQTLYGMADLFIIGQFEGVASTTAVSIGQAVGAGDRKKAASGIGNTVTLFMCLSVVLTVALLIFVRPVVNIMSTPEAAMSGTIEYLTICFIGIPFITAYNIISSIFRGLGDSKSPMYFIAVACAANIALDYLFMGALHLGPSGAALGTTLSQAVSVIIALVVIRRHSGALAVKKTDFRPARPVMAKLLRIGVPIAMQDGLIQIAFIIITVIANRRGLNDAAAVGIVEKIISFLFLVPSSMLSTVSALGAQNIGAGKPERARLTLRYAACIAICFGVCMMILMQFAAEPVVSLFTDRAQSDGAEVIRLGGQYMRGYVWDCIFAGVHFSFSGYFCACGRSGLSFLHNISAILLVRVPGVYLTSLFFPDTLFPMGLATSMGSLLSVIICVIAYTVILSGKKSSFSGNHI